MNVVSKEQIHEVEMTNQLITLFKTVLVIAALFASVAGQGELKDKKITIKMENVAFGNVLETLIEKYDIPFGFEHSRDFESLLDFDFEPNIRHELQTDNALLRMPNRTFQVRKHFISVSFDEGRLGDVLDNLVSQMADYDWEIKEGVVNFIPAKNRDELIRNLLDVKIGKFKVKDQPSIIFVENEILGSLELKKFAEQNETCLRKLGELNPVYSRRKLTEPIRYSNLTLRELLNRITVSKRGGWIVQRIRYENNVECIAIRI